MFLTLRHAFHVPVYGGTGVAAAAPPDPGIDWGAEVKAAKAKQPSRSRARDSAAPTRAARRLHEAPAPAPAVSEALPAEAPVPAASDAPPVSAPPDAVSGSDVPVDSVPVAGGDSPAAAPAVSVVLADRPVITPPAVAVAPELPARAGRRGRSGSPRRAPALRSPRAVPLAAGLAWRAWR